ncbi:type I restriction enzyme, S subunit [Pseudomonas pohangensis]|uniref:Type I restriction enzyme, S subunit n=1 Tax=Pseudomonas pohangensis TaxID=364197 RepID=A0A1H2GZD2_9PSED|nr:restriction endonuclease subunit S [Pseudomonas pohangensis]SDU24954.1 type I restriction enzyme, S subunit [Pseudomonas pohangensis]
MTFPAYPAYKDSGIEWLGKVPEHWEEKPFFSLVSERCESNSGMKQDNLLSLSYGCIVNKDINTLDGLLPASFETYQLVYPGDIVFRLTDLQNDKRSLRSAIVREVGIITSAYLAGRCVNILSEFANHLFRAYDTIKVFYSMGGGLRQSMKYSDMKWLPIFLPSDQEQAKIACFLDYETVRIDALIEEQQHLIELLKEKRQAVISHAVTKGLDPTVPMKDSGVEWLGEVPAHWICKSYRYASVIYRGKFSHRPRNDPSLYDGDYAFIQTGDIARADKYIRDYKQTLNEKGVAVSQKFPAETLVMAIAANVGDTAILGFEAYAPDSVVGFKPEKDIELEFLRFSLIAALQELKKTSTQSTQANLNIDRISGIQSVFPPVTEQVEITGYLNVLMEQFSLLEQQAMASIELMNERRAALISAAVTGKIDVRGWQPPASTIIPELEQEAV